MPNGSIEGIPLITRFKTFLSPPFKKMSLGIEGIPLITRFKTMYKSFYKIKHIQY